MNLILRLFDGIASHTVPMKVDKVAEADCRDSARLAGYWSLHGSIFATIVLVISALLLVNILNSSSFHRQIGRIVRNPMIHSVALATGMYPALQAFHHLDEHDVLAYLARYFPDAAAVLTAMRRNGVVLSGSRALDVFAAGSSTTTSDFDFYVSPEGNSIYGFMKDLEAQGIKWRTCAEILRDRVRAAIGSGTGSIEVSRRTALALLAELETLDLTNDYMFLYRPLAGCLAPLTVPYTLYFKAVVDINMEEPRALYTFVLRELVAPAGQQQGLNDAFQEDPIVDGMGLVNQDHDFDYHWLRDFSVVRGSLQSADGHVTEVQLIFSRKGNWKMNGGQTAGSIAGALPNLVQFHSSHVQAFITGYGGGQLYRRITNQRAAWKWIGPAHNEDRDAAARTKYQGRDWSFYAAKERTVFRSMSDCDARVVEFDSSDSSPNALHEKMVLQDFCWFEDQGKLSQMRGPILTQARKAGPAAVDYYFNLPDADPGNVTTAHTRLSYLRRHGATDPYSS